MVKESVHNIDDKVITIRFNIETWKRLKALQLHGKIDSIQAACTESLGPFIDRKEKLKGNRRKKKPESPGIRD